MTSDAGTRLESGAGLIGCGLRLPEGRSNYDGVHS